LVLPKLIAEFNKRHQKIEFEVFEDSTKNLIHKLNAGEVDLIIDNVVITDENIISNVYKPEMILLAVPKKFKINDTLSQYKMTAKDVKENKHISNCPGVELKYFSKLPFILLNQENDTGKRAEKLFKKYFVSPNIIFRLDQQVTAYNISCTGMGLSFVSDTLVKNIAETEELYYYKIADRYCNRNIYIYSKKNRYLSLACRKFIEYNI
jgi:DNA-binding transcriptional LysR family regulator